MTTSTHPLQQIIETYNGYKEIDFDFIRKRGDQEAAFDNCVEFLKRVKRTKHVYTGGGHNYSGHLKHLVESPFNKLAFKYREKLSDIERCGLDIYTGYVYKGTFYLAARSMGFRCKGDNFYPKSLNVSFNIAKRGMDDAILSYINYMKAKHNL